MKTIRQVECLRRGRRKPAARYCKYSASLAFAISLRSRYSELLTLSILRVKISLSLTVSADATTPRSLSLETRPLISCLRSASPNRRSGDCKMGVGGNKWAHTGHLFSHTSCFTTSHGGKVFARRFQIASAIFKHSKRKANRIAGFAPEASPVCGSFSRSCP